MAEDTLTLAYGYAWDERARDWTRRVEYIAQDLHEAQNWLRFNRDWFTNCGIERQQDEHVFDYLRAFDE
jgi:hypothetical protein